MASSDLERQVNLLVSDDSLPVHLWTVLAYLVEDRKRMQASINTFCDLIDEAMSLLLGNAHLKQLCSMLEDLAPNSSPTISHGPIQSYDHIFSNRSAVPLLCLLSPMKKLSDPAR